MTWRDARATSTADALAGVVAARGKLRHDDSLAGAGRALEGGDALVPRMGTVFQQWILRHDLLQQIFPLDERMLAQILVVEIQQIEHAIEEAHFLTIGVPQELEAGAAMRSSSRDVNAVTPGGRRWRKYSNPGSRKVGSAQRHRLSAGPERPHVHIPKNSAERIAMA